MPNRQATLPIFAGSRWTVTDGPPPPSLTGACSYAGDRANIGTAPIYPHMYTYRGGMTISPPAPAGCPDPGGDGIR